MFAKHSISLIEHTIAVATMVMTNTAAEAVPAIKAVFDFFIVDEYSSLF